MRIVKHTLMASMLAAALSGPAGIALAMNATSTDDAPRETQVHPVRGFLPDLRFNLVGPGSKPISEADFRGKVVMMFFGYSSCPDICPTTMAQLSQVMHLLADDADKVRILFVSVDPHRDTPDKLQAYVEAFDNHAIA